MPYFRPIESGAGPNYLDLQDVSHRTVVSPASAFRNHCPGIDTVGHNSFTNVCLWLYLHCMCVVYLLHFI